MKEHGWVQVLQMVLQQTREAAEPESGAARHQLGHSRGAVKVYRVYCVSRVMLCVVVECEVNC